MEQNRTVAEAMKENGSIIVLYKKEIRKAQAMLIAGEDVRCAISGALYIDTAGEQPDTKRKTVDSNSGVLVLTDRRLFFVGFFGVLNMELDIGALRSVEAFDDRGLGAMRVVAEEDVLRFRDKRQCIAAMARAINKALGIEVQPCDEPGVSRYQGADGYLELSYETVTVCKENLPKPVESVLAYGEIDSMVFREATEDGLGYLAIRDINSDSPPVKTESDAAACETAILFDGSMNGQFREAYGCLEKNIPPVDKKTARHTKIRKPRRSNSAEIRCPNCGSLRHRVYRYPWFNPNIITDARLRLISSFMRLYTVLVLEGRTLECCDCGCRWRP